MSSRARWKYIIKHGERLYHHPITGAKGWYSVTVDAWTDQDQRAAREMFEYLGYTVINLGKYWKITGYKKIK